MWAREWLDEFWREDEKGKMSLLLGNGVEGIGNIVMEDVGEYVLYWLGRWWQRRKQLFYGKFVVGYWSSLLSPLSLHSL